MPKRTQIRFHAYLLPSLGNLVTGEKNLLSPLRLRFDQKATPEEFRASGLLDSQGKLKAEYQPILHILANPSSLVDLRFSAGSQFQQFSLYYGKPEEAPVLLMNTQEGLLLEHPANAEGILDGLSQFSSDSLIASFDFQADLPYGSALALAALVDLQRREVARAFADLSALKTQPANTADVAGWIAQCPEDPQWVTALIRKSEDQAPGEARLQADLTLLVEREICEQTGQGYQLSGAALLLGNRLVLVDTLFTLDIARLGSSGRAAVASITALQAGVNDLLQIEFQGDGILFTSLSPMAFLEQVAHYLEKGGSELPDLSVEEATPEFPASASVGEPASEPWGLAVPGLASPFLLAGTITIGRTSDCDLQLDDNKASRQHARIERRLDGYWISDLGSSNGVFVNKQPIHQPVQLAPGDQILIGDTLLKVMGQSSSPVEAATMINLQSPVNQPPVYDQAVPPAQGAVLCPQCGQPVAPSVRFCAQCGATIPKKCPQCGAILSEQARFCKKCGATIEP